MTFISQPQGTDIPQEFMITGLAAIRKCLPLFIFSTQQSTEPVRREQWPWTKRLQGTGQNFILIATLCTRLILILKKYKGLKKKKSKETVRNSSQ